MNFRLRRRHLRTLAVIAPLAFVGLLLALDARSRNNDEVWDGVQPRAALDTLEAIEPKPSSVAPAAWERDDLWEGAEIQSRLWRPQEQSGDDGYWLELTPLTALRRPDVLLYWLPDEAGVTSRASATMPAPVASTDAVPPTTQALPGAPTMAMAAADSTPASAGGSPWWDADSPPPPRRSAARVSISTTGAEADAMLARYPKSAARDYDGDPARVTEMDALIAYLQMLGTLVDFSTYKAEENYR